MATIGTLAYRITANVSSFNAGCLATRSEIRNLRNAFIASASATDVFNAGITRLNNLRQAGLDVRLYAAGIRTLGQEALQSSPLIAGLTSRLGALAAAYALWRTVTSAASAGIEFDTAMRNSMAIMKDLSETMRGDLRKAALEVGYQTRTSAVEAAEGLRHLSSANFSAAESIKALLPLAKFAQAGMFDMAKAVDYAAGAQTALGLKTKDPTQNMNNLIRLTDLLTASNNIGLGAVEEYSKALATNAASSMRAFGISVEGGLAVLIGLHSQLTQGEDAGTAFSIMIRDLMTKSIENADAFKRMGVEVYDLVTGKLREPVLILKDLDKALSGLSDKNKKIALHDRFGFADKSVNAIQKMVGMSNELEASWKQLIATSGTVAEVSSKQMGGWEQAIQMVSTAWTELSDKLAAPVLNFFGKMIIATVEILRGMHGSLLKVIDGTALWVIGTTVLTGVIAVLSVAIMGAVRAASMWISAQVILLSLQGPRGWAILAGSAVFAGIAMAGVVASLGNVGEEAAQASKNVKEFKKDLDAASSAVTKELPGEGPGKDFLKHHKKLQDAIEKNNQKEAKKSTKLFEDFFEKGQKLADKMRTPFEKFRDAVKDINALFDMGAINAITKVRAIAAERQDLLEAMNNKKKNGPGSDGEIKFAESGTQEAFAADFKQAMDREVDMVAETLEVEKEILVVNTRQADALDEIKRRRDLGELPVVTF